jgi:phasin
MIGPKASLALLRTHLLPVNVNGRAMRCLFAMHNIPVPRTSTMEDPVAMNQGMKYEIPTEMRDFAEKSVEQARKAFDGFLTAAQKAMESFEGSSSSMQSSATDATRRTLTFAEQNITAAFDHAQKLVRARDLQEAFQLQSEFARAQFAAMQGQMKELGDLASSTARTVSSQAASAAGQAAAAARNAADQATASMNPNRGQNES